MSEFLGYCILCPDGRSRRNSSTVVKTKHEEIPKGPVAIDPRTWSADGHWRLGSNYWVKYLIGLKVQIKPVIRDFPGGTHARAA
jgi:hypothetical protein